MDGAGGAPVFADVGAAVRALRPGTPVYCLYPDRIRDAVRRFLRAFPGAVFYAVKCNPHPAILRLLFDAGVRHFDVASEKEMRRVHGLFGGQAHLHFMHPVKARSAIRAARALGVRDFVVDHASELRKVLDETDDGQPRRLFVRVATPSSGAIYDLSVKFGAASAEASVLLRTLHETGVEAGLAFHIGSQCVDPSAFRTAIRVIRTVLDGAADAPVCALDVGGGFPISYTGAEAPPLGAFITELKGALPDLPLQANYELSCEPGRALVGEGVSLIVQVLLRKEDAIYINDGVYGSLSEMVTAGLRFPARLIRPGERIAPRGFDFAVFGPTCDSTDVLPTRMRLPWDVREGDWVEIRCIGAYSNALTTDFNGFQPDRWVTISG